MPQRSMHEDTERGRALKAEFDRRHAFELRAAGGLVAWCELGVERRDRLHTGCPAGCCPVFGALPCPSTRVAAMVEPDGDD